MEEMQKTFKIKWWMIVIPVLVAAGVLIGVFWQPIVLQLAPEKALASAASKTWKSLEKRLESTPVAFIDEAVGESTVADVDLGLYMKAPGQMDVEMDVSMQLDTEKSQSAANVHIYASNQEMKLYLFVDRHKLLLQSKDFLGEPVYGIDLDKFEEDLEVFRNKNLWIGNEAIESFRETILELRDALNQDDEPLDPALLEPYIRCMQKWAEGLMEPTRGKAQFAWEGAVYDCQQIEYEVAVSYLADLMNDLIDILESDEALMKRYVELSQDARAWDVMMRELREYPKEIEDSKDSMVVQFWLYKGQILALELCPVSEEALDISRMVLFLGEDPGTCNLEFCAFDAEGAKSFAIRLQRDAGEQVLEESLVIRDRDYETRLGYRWNAEAGKLDLYMDDAVLPCKLVKVEQGVRLEMDMQPLMEEFGGAQMGRIEYTAYLELRAGEAIQIPANTSFVEIPKDVLVALTSLFAIE